MLSAGERREMLKRLQLSPVIALDFCTLVQKTHIQ